LQSTLACNSVTVDVCTVEASEIAQHVQITAQLDNAVFFRNDSVKQLNRVAGVPTKRIMGNKLDDFLAFRGREQQVRHTRFLSYSASLSHTRLGTVVGVF
jgi:hypothetical protein